MIMTNSSIGGLGGGAMTGGGLVVNNLTKQSLSSGPLMSGPVNQQQQQNMHHPGHPAGGMQNGPIMNVAGRVAAMQQNQHNMVPRGPGPHLMGGPRMQAPNMQIGKFCFFFL